MQRISQLREQLSQQRWGGIAGITATGIAFLAITAAIVLSDSFSWTYSALSDLGSPSSAVAPVFNIGLIAAGILGLVFGIYRIREAETRWEWASIGLFNIAMFGLGMVGVYPIGTPWHFDASLLFFAGFTYALLLYGSVNVWRGDLRSGIASIWGGILHATVWGVWLASLRPWIGIAVPETVGAVIAGGWVITQSLILLDRQDYLPLADQ